MRSRRQLGLSIIVLLISSAGCESTPGDPLDGDLGGLERIGGSPGSFTLSSLVYDAIRGVYSEQGAAAARDLVQSLARVQQMLEEAPVEERAALRRTLREAQLGIVLRVHGSEVVTRTIEGVAAEAAALRQRRDALAASGIHAPEVSAVLEQLPALIAHARSAPTEIEALDAATRAAAMTNRMSDAVTGAARVPTLSELFDEAAARLGGSMVADARARRDAAAEAVRAGDRTRAEAAVRAARDAQIGVVLAALGPDAVADVIGWARDRAEEQKESLRAAGEARDVSRLERMNHSAADMLQRAEMRLRRGDAAEALDLAAHAVDLLNALESTLTSY